MLASAGSLAVEGSLSGWVANHRRHHVFMPTSPAIRTRRTCTAPECARSSAASHTPTSAGCSRATSRRPTRYAPELLNDADTRIISRLFPAFAVFSLAAPFFLGWTLSGAIGGALTALLWAGLARMVLLHHVTWSVNSICHMFGKQPATQKDQSRNFAPLGILSMGEAWHNFHHAHPTSARHGALRRQFDPSAALIRLFERAGWVTHVRWPTDARTAALSRRVAHGT